MAGLERLELPESFLFYFIIQEQVHLPPRQRQDTLY